MVYNHNIYGILRYLKKLVNNFFIVFEIIKPQKSVKMVFYM